MVVSIAVRRHTAGPDVESLTNCQAKRTTVAVWTVRCDTAEPSGMEYSPAVKSTGLDTRVAVTQW